MKLKPEEIHLLFLMQRDAVDGWTKVSKFVWRFVALLPAQLVELKGDSINGGFAKLTPEGEIMLRWVK